MSWIKPRRHTSTYILIFILVVACFMIRDKRTNNKTHTYKLQSTGIDGMQNQLLSTQSLVHGGCFGGDLHTMFIQKQVYSQLISSQSYTQNKLVNTSYVIKHMDGIGMEGTKTIELLIHETHMGKPTIGGSSFFIESKSEWLDVCQYKDYFNGTYHACCPIWSPCTTINITLHFINFGAYTVKQVPCFERNIYTHRTCISSALYYHVPLTPKNMSIETARCAKVWNKSPVSGVGRWRSVNSGWHWYEQGCPLPRLNSYDTCYCVMQYKSITFIGNSHVRYSMFHILHACGIMPMGLPEKPDNLTVARFHYVSLKYVSDFTAWVNKTISTNKRKKTENDIVVIMAGSWDLAFPKDNKTKLVTYADHFYEAMSILKHSKQWSNARIIWWPDMPTPIIHTCRTGYFKNNYQTMALNYLMKERLDRLAIEIVDVFALQYPHFNDSPKECYVHYLCLSKHYRLPRKVLGNTGQSFMDLFLQRLCSKKKY